MLAPPFSTLALPPSILTSFAEKLTTLPDAGCPSGAVGSQLFQPPVSTLLTVYWAASSAVSRFAHGTRLETSRGLPSSVLLPYSAYRAVFSFAALPQLSQP